MDWRFFSLTLLSLEWSGVHANLNVNIPQKTYEFARGDNITLPCNFVPKGTPTVAILTWTAEEDYAGAATKVVGTYYYSPNPHIDISPAYEGRAALDVDFASGKSSLKLFSITLADNKIFTCRLQIPGFDEGKVADMTKLVVLVAPSVPDCDIQGKQEYGQNITLTCKSKEGSPLPTYKWEGRDVRNIPRVLPPRTTDKNGILSLYNISKETSGYYICTATNKIRSTQCNITVSVYPPTISLGSTGTIIGIVAAIVGVIAIIVIVYCCCCRKKKQDEQYAMGVREDEYHDEEKVKNGESRQPDGEEDPAEHRDRYDEGSERNEDRHSDYDDRRDRRNDYDDRRDRRNDYDDHRDRRNDYDDRRNDDRRSDYDDRRSDYDDRRSDYDDRRSDYDDRRSDYNDRRRDNYDRGSNYDDCRDRYDDSYDRRDDEGGRERRYDDRH